MSENERLDQVPEEEPAGTSGAEQAPSEQAKSEQAEPEKAKSEQAKAEKKSKAGAPSSKKTKKKAKGNRFTRWLREMRSELKKVQWPGWKQVLKNTGIVILCVLVIGVFIWIFDALAHMIIDALLHLVKQA